MEDKKRCSRCKGYYPRNESFFYKNKRSRDGLSYHCRSCHKKQSEGERYKANKKWGLKYPEKRDTQKRRYYAQFKKNNRNRHQLWTTGDLDLITAEDRSSDRVLSEKLGRTVNAIQGMRALLKKCSKTTIIKYNQ